MDLPTGIAFGGIALSVIITIAGAAWHVSRKLAVVETKLNNGLTTTLNTLTTDVRRVFDKVDSMPCTDHSIRAAEQAVRMAEIEKRLDKLEE